MKIPGELCRDVTTVPEKISKRGIRASAASGALVENYSVWIKFWPVYRSRLAKLVRDRDQHDAGRVEREARGDQQPRAAARAVEFLPQQDSP